MFSGIVTDPQNQFFLMASTETTRIFSFGTAIIKNKTFPSITFVSERPNLIYYTHTSIKKIAAEVASMKKIQFFYLFKKA